MKTSSAKAKGRKLQQIIAKKISDITGIKYGKDEDIDSRPMGQSGVDVILRGEAKKLFPFSVECKNVENLNLLAAIKQAKDNQQKDTDWLLFWKKNREDVVVVMDADVFFEMYEWMLEMQKERTQSNEEFLERMEYGLKHPTGPIATPKIDEAIEKVINDMDMKKRADSLIDRIKSGEKEKRILQ